MTTTNKGLNEPAANSPNWDVPLNQNFGYIDAALGEETTKSATGVGTTPVVLTTAEYRNLILTITGTLTANVTYHIPSGIGGQWIVANSTTGSFTLTIGSAGGGASVVIPTGGRRTVYSDGTNVYGADNSTAAIGSSGTIIYNNGTNLTGSTGLLYDGSKVTVTLTSATTNAGVEALRINTQSSGTPAAGFGPMITMEGETSPGVSKVGGQIVAAVSDVSVGSEDFDFVFNLMAAGLTANEKLRLKSTGELIPATALWTTNVKGKTGGDDALINGILPIAASAVPGLSTGMTLLGTITTNTGTSASLSALVLTGYKYLLFDCNGVTSTGTGSRDVRIGGVIISATSSSAAYGQAFVSLVTGRIWGGVCPDGSTVSIYVGNTSYTTATTTVTVSTGATFTAGSVLVYGMK